MQLDRILDFYARHLHLRMRTLYAGLGALSALVVWLVWHVTDGMDASIPDWWVYWALPALGIFGLGSASFALATVTGPLRRSDAQDIATTGELTGQTTDILLARLLTGRRAGTADALADAGERLIHGLNDGKVDVDPANAFVGASIVAIGGILWTVLGVGEQPAVGLFVAVFMSPILLWSIVRLSRESRGG